MKMSRILQALSIIILIGISVRVPAQTNHLEKKITIHLNRIELKNALPKIGESGNFQFAYNSEIIPGDSLVSVDATNKPVKQVLYDLVGPDIRYKVLGNHIILLNEGLSKRVARDEEPREYIITGYIYDAMTGEIISSASIYEVEGMFVSATNSDGFYSLTVPGDREKQVLSYSKVGYNDTLIIVKPKEQLSLSVSLKPITRVPSEFQLSAPAPASINQRKLVMALVPSKTRVTADNVQVIEQRWVQVSFLPFIGSNRFVSGLITNRFSLNILAGYAGGVRGLELGGFLNVVRNEMHGVQAAGFGNIVGRDSKGAQLSGFFNVDAGSFTGLQATGFSNVVTDTIRGVQLAGFSNVLRGPIYGAQLSGFSNFSSHNMDGIQASGFANTAIKDVKVAQLSGFANYCRNLGGLQAAGFTNIASGTCKGVQMAGFLNYATDLHGLQLSVLNIADTVSSGVPVGILSFVIKGYHTIELTANELFPLNLSLKTGTRHFYNILSAGIQSDWLSVGYGVGTQFRMAKRLTLSMDLTANYVADNEMFIETKGSLLRFSPTLDIELAKHFKIILGPTLNVFSSLSTEVPDMSAIPALFSLPVFSQTVGPLPVNVWIGATAGIRL
ncbi:MAG: STN and carboxypeptidase regulatory-like domain-containing protein [Bacteroidota bacterium]